MAVSRQSYLLPHEAKKSGLEISFKVFGSTILLIPGISGRRHYYCSFNKRNLPVGRNRSMQNIINDVSAGVFIVGTALSLSGVSVSYRNVSEDFFFLNDPSLTGT